MQNRQQCGCCVAKHPGSTRLVLAAVLGVVIFSIMSASGASAVEVTLLCEGRCAWENSAPDHCLPMTDSYVFAIDDQAMAVRVVTPSGYAVRKGPPYATLGTRLDYRFEDAEIDFIAEIPASADDDLSWQRINVWINRLAGSFKLEFHSGRGLYHGHGGYVPYEGTCHKATKQF